MRLTSLSFTDGNAIPERYAFGKIAEQGHVALSDNVSPDFAWSDVPDGVKSFVLVCHDPDVPSKPDDVNQEGREVPASLPRVDFYHWLLIDLPAHLRAIKESAFSSGITPHGKGANTPETVALGARQGINDYTSWFAGDHDMAGDYYGYDGPCPPWNDAIVHRYTFTLYALDIEKLPVAPDFRGPDLLAALAGHVLARATLVGLYTLNPTLNPRLAPRHVGNAQA